jgi:hypothetical protein
MSTSLQSYPYHQLPQDDTFRYLVLQPGTGDEPLVCQLQTAPISTTEYYTVSYVWGTEIRDQRILCDGYSIGITPNLSKVLQRVRLPDKPLSAWADGICINQEDKDEKGHQVALMGRIYRSAVGLSIYIGSDDHGHGSAVCSLLDEVDDMIQSTCREIDTTWDSFPYPREEETLLKDVRWNSLYQLLSQSWFDRGWVVQEAALAAQSEVLWGQSNFCWQKLMRTYLWLYTRGVGLFYTIGFDKVLIGAHTGSYLEGHKNFAQVFFDEDSWGTPSILQTLSYAKDLDLKDQRDRIYAFLDLPHNDAHRITMRPDYFVPYLETYRQFAVEYVRATKRLELLEYVCHYETPSSNTPSWVPRWDVPSWSVSQSCLNTSETLQPYKPSTFVPIVTQDGKLKVRGVIMDYVHYISDPFDADTITTETIRRVWERINAEPSESLYTTLGAAKSHLLDAFLYALCSGIYEGEWAQWRQERHSFALEALLKSAHVEDDRLPNSAGVGAHENTQENIFFQFVRSRTHKRRFIVTERGYIGLGPLIMHEGDACGIIFGCQTPCILRKAPDNQTYMYIGATALMGAECLELEEGEVAFVNILGDEESKDWVDWDVEEQDIYLC